MLFAPFNKKGSHGTADENGVLIYDYPKERTFKVENLTGIIKEGKSQALKYREMTISGFGLPVSEYTLGGLPSADTPNIKKLAGNPDKGEYGDAYKHF